MAKEDDLLPKNSAPRSPVLKTGRASGGVSAPMLRIIRATRVLGILLGGSVSLVGVMSVVGLVTDNLWVRLVLATLLVVLLPAFVADRLLKRMRIGGGLSVVTDVFAILLLGIALVFVTGEVFSKPLLTREGDRHAMRGARVMARASYFLAGVSPVFPDEKADAGPLDGGAGDASPDGGR